MPAATTLAATTLAATALAATALAATALAATALAANGRTGYAATMSLLLDRLARYAAQRLASSPEVRETAAKAARAVVDEVTLIARDEDRARAAGRSFRRALEKLQGKR